MTADEPVVSTSSADGPTSTNGLVAVQSLATIVGFLSSTGSIQNPVRGHASLHGYLVVWSVCAVAALLAAHVLLLRPPSRHLHGRMAHGHLGEARPESGPT